MQHINWRGVRPRTVSGDGFPPAVLMADYEFLSNALTINFGYPLLI